MQDQQVERQQEQLSQDQDITSEEIAQTEAAYTRDYAYYKEVFAGRPMPFAYLDLDLLEQNIRQVVERANGKRVRLASKSLRSVAVIRRILAADPCFQGIMCFTCQEAVYLAHRVLTICSSVIPPGIQRILPPSRKQRPPVRISR